MMIKEACVEGLSEALRAQELGADRIELCENLMVGGTTPSLGTILACKKYLRIPVVVMIRPRGGNFVYTSAELEIMALDIKACSNAGADGIAIGILNSDNTINLHDLEKMVKISGKMEITFHKAIDVSADPYHEFLRLRNSRLVHRILTSGGAQTAIEGAPLINRMIETSASLLNILVAGKVSVENLSQVSALIHANEFHGKRIVGDLNITH